MPKVIFGKRKSSNDRWGTEAIVFSSLALHIGLHKTGSTAIQYELDRPLTNRFALYVPYLQHDKETLDSEQVDGLAARLERANNSATRTVLISNEGFCGTYMDGYEHVQERLTELRDLFDFANPRVILTVRPPETWIRSCFADYVKQGGSLDLENFALSVGDSPQFVIDRVVTTARAIFGDVLLIDSEVGDVVKEVIRNIGGAPPGEKPKRRKRWNQSPSDQEIELIRSLNVAGASPRDRELVVSFLNSESDQDRQKLLSNALPDPLRAIQHVKKAYSSPSRQIRSKLRNF